jgi:CheY-like chemotaxis protein
VSGLNGCTILVADDERYVTTIISLKLRQAGAMVITAIDGAQAFEMACLHEPDLICSDFQMPLMNGLQLAERLKTTDRTAHIPMLILTARGHRISLSQLARTNIRAVLAKPFSARELLAKLMELAMEAGVAA